MKNWKFVPLLTLASLSFVNSTLALASPSDIRFRGDSRFILTEEIQGPQGKAYIRFSGCQADSQGATARCSHLAAIEKAGFAKMRAWYGASAAGSFLGVLGSFVTAVVGGAATGGIAAVPGAAGVVYFIANTNRASDISENIFSKAVEQDQDFTSSRSYEDYVRFLKRATTESLWRIDAAEYVISVDSTPFTIRLR